MKGKSLAVSILSVIVVAIASYSALFSPSAQAWLGIASFTITAVLSTFASSGTWPKGWSSVLWITNIAGVVIQVLSAIGDKALIDPAIVNYLIIGINILLTGFVKDYGSGSVVENAKS